jgi:hypothetical protein
VTARPSGVTHPFCVATGRHDRDPDSPHRTSQIHGAVGRDRSGRIRHLRALREQRPVPVLDGAGHRPARHYAAHLATRAGCGRLAGHPRAPIPRREAAGHHAPAAAPARAAGCGGDGGRGGRRGTW